MYVVLGASGHTGSIVAEKLLQKGEKVRVVGRSKERLWELANKGAEPFETDSNDSARLAQAFEGAKAIYFLVPPDPANSDYRKYQDEVVEAGAKALETSRVRYAVTLSSIGADQTSGTGPVLGLHDMEARFNGISGLNVLHLRAGYFMENTLAQTAVIQNFGMMAGPVRADVPLAMIATRDIGSAAADSLLSLDFSGSKTRELLGPRDVTYNEVAKIVGNAVGKPGLAYMQMPNEQFVQAVKQMGMSEDFARLIAEMSDSINDNRMKSLEKRSSANTTPTSYETFVQEVFVPAYRGKAAKA